MLKQITWIVCVGRCQWTSYTCTTMVNLERRSRVICYCLWSLGSATLHKKERYFFTSLGPKSELFSMIRFPPKHEAKWKITKKLWTASRNTSSSKSDHKCGKCGHMGHFEVCCHSKQNKGRDSSRSSSRGRGTSRTKPGRRRRGGNSKEQRDAHNMTGDTSAENRVSNDDFYMFRQHREHWWTEHYGTSDWR